MVTNTFDLETFDSYSAGDFPKLLTIHARRNNCEEHLIGLTRMATFVGVVVGETSRALFGVGEYRNNMIILDPHYVQAGEAYESFSQRIPQAINPSHLCACVAINFYIPSLEVFYDWVFEVVRLDKLCSPNTLFTISVKDEKWCESARKFSDDFQVI